VGKVIVGSVRCGCGYDVAISWTGERPWQIYATHKGDGNAVVRVFMNSILDPTRYLATYLAGRMAQALYEAGAKNYSCVKYWQRGEDVLRELMEG
jgi:hypothetical protein